MYKFIPIVLLSFLLSSCGAKMPSDELFPQFEECGPTPLDQVILEERLTVVFDTPGNVTRKCMELSGIDNVFVMIAAAIFYQPVACAYAQWEDIGKDPCHPHWTVYVPPGNRFLLEHELKHVQGYKD